MTPSIDYVKEYDNSGRVADAEQLIENYAIDAALFREEDDRIADYDIEYAPRARNRMDIFWPNTDEGIARESPLVMFIHGGYWQNMDKSSFSHVARGLNLNGIAVVVPSYTLCPNTKVEGIITELRCACLVLFKTYKKTFAVVGHSAGGHLAACMMATDWEALHSGLPHDLVTSGMGISGLYDLLPLLQTPVNDAVRMDEEQARRASPLNWVPDGLQRFQAWVGGDESNEYHRQSRELAFHWSLMGTPTDYVPIPGKNHFTIIDGLTDPESTMTKALVDLAENPQAPNPIQEPEEEAEAEAEAEAHADVDAVADTVVDPDADTIVEVEAEIVEPQSEPSPPKTKTSTRKKTPKKANKTKSGQKKIAAKTTKKAAAPRKKRNKKSENTSSASEKPTNSTNTKKAETTTKEKS